MAKCWSSEIISFLLWVAVSLDFFVKNMSSIPILLPCFIKYHLVDYLLFWCFLSRITSINSSWLVSKSVSLLDIIFSMLFNLLLASKAIFLCLFFSFPSVFKNVLTNKGKNTRQIIALTITTDVPMTVLNEKRETSLPIPDKTSKVLSV